ncbi:MAG: ornithine cyclodeaminase family protein [Candidatus Eisenbacteria bacterium]|uniref:Ornithine cyclodeaminase family protein n=1 Tax=Eiseniibacteriota bacterium TaxID=2212470 RepID=A0A538T746_UNCEI|nr:MAG: ornithine cyclodeaminase family protein [Candidatus Eisenbacteria bacterium]
MSTLVIPQRDVSKLLPMAECVDLMAEALRTLSRGHAVLPLRTAVWLPDRSGLLGVMPAYLGAPPSMGLKAVSVMPGNHGTEYDSHQGVVLLFEIEHGSLLAVIDATSITAIRTAAVSAAATRLLAREDAGDLAILGSGVQAASHLEAMRVARPIRRVRVWSRDAAHARSFAERESARYGSPVEAVADPRAAVERADLICTTTASREPVLRGEWLSPGVHINAVGSSFATGRELDTPAVKRAKLYVDRLESALHEAGDFLIPRTEGAIGEDHIVGEVGEAFLGRIEGRRSGKEITLFKSVGLAVEDLAAAHHVYEKARESGAGIAIELGGRRDQGH